MTEQTQEGGCLCGAVRYKITGAPVRASVCHCSICRRAGAAASMSWATFKKDQVSFTHAQPSLYASSEVAQRGYCPTCGTQISLTASYMPGLIDITIGSLDNPDSIKPSIHYWGTRRVPWVRYAYSASRDREAEVVEQVE